MSRLALWIVGCLIAMASGISQTSTAGVQHPNAKALGFVRALEFKHRLRVCNAYPYAAALDVYRGKQEKLTEEAVAYKGCEDFTTPLKAGDKLSFKVGDANAGTFSISDLPNNDAVLLLVIHRHDTLSTAVSFESHVFANLLNAQIAIIDTYKGRTEATASIRDHASAKGSRVEQLRYNSVVAVNPGKYEVVLKDLDGKEEGKTDLVALNRESYIIMRTGVEAQQGPSYPQELVVYPKSDPAMLGAAAAAGIPAKLIVALLTLAILRR